MGEIIINISKTVLKYDGKGYENIVRAISQRKTKIDIKSTIKKEGREKTRAEDKQ